MKLPVTEMMKLSDLCTQSVYIAEKVSVDSLQDTSQITLAKNGAPIALGGDL